MRQSCKSFACPCRQRRDGSDTPLQLQISHLMHVPERLAISIKPVSFLCLSRLLVVNMSQHVHDIDPVALQHRANTSRRLTKLPSQRTSVKSAKFRSSVNHKHLLCEYGFFTTACMSIRRRLQLALRHDISLQAQ
ncbi:hypothetical protein MRB53_037121 [Persea americana]|nr:hypothetical protein MRB53_037121 [Persea americana]